MKALRQTADPGYRATAIIAAALLLSARPAVRLSAQYPTQPPAARPLRPMQFPPFQEARLANGLQLVVVENHELPVVSLSLSLPVGSRHDPAGMEGLADVVAELLTKGTRTRTADQIAAAIEGVGASLSATAGTDFTTVGTTVLTENLELAFELTSDVVLNATFPEAELELARTRMLSGLRLEQSDPGALADRYFAQTLYGQHPYGRRPTEPAVKAVTRQAVQDFAGARLKPGGALLVLAGDVTLARARELATRFFGSWSGTAPAAQAASAPPAPRAMEILLVHRPGSAQSNIIVGNLGQRPGDPLFFPATVGNRVLGGGADARLFLILREQKGWTYGAYSGLTRRKDVGYWSATAEVRTPVTDSAMVELLRQLGRVRTEAVSDSELTAAKGYLVGSFPRQIETPQQIASQVSNVKLYGLGERYLRTYRERLSAVTAADIQRALRSLIRPDSAVIVVVGDGQQIYEKLRAIAPVRIIDGEGKPLTPDDLTPRGGLLPLDRSLLTSRTDSFRITLQGNPLGTQASSLRVTRDSIVFVESSVLGPFGQQQTTVVFNPADLSVVQVTQTGQFGGQSQELRATYGGGRVKSHAVSPQPGGTAKTVDVDTTVAANTYDENAIHVLLLALPLEAGKTFNVSTFDATDGTTRVLSLKVGAAESVTVPAGTFQALRVEVTGGRQPLNIYVTAQGPRRLVKLEPVGAPLVFELVR